MRRMSYGILSFMLLVSMFAFLLNIQPAVSEPSTITVPDDYLSIQEAINHADEGDTVFVRSGIYYEHVVINKTDLKLIGESRSNTIIDGNGSGRVVSVISYTQARVRYSFGNEQITGFTIQRGSTGIHVECSWDMTINDCKITHCNNAITMTTTWRNLICDLEITENTNIGILLRFTVNSTIKDNTISNNKYGISLDRCWLYLVDHWYDRNKIMNNKILSNSVGISIEDSRDNTIAHNNFTGNSLDAVPDVWRATNFFDDGYPSGGNYWSRYKGKDNFSGPYQNETGSDGIGDTPHVFWNGHQDNYPLFSRSSQTSPSHNANAIWLEPSTINLSRVTVGDRFNVTAWVNITDPSFIWQARMNFNRTLLNAVRSGYSGPFSMLSGFFTGHFTIPVNAVINNDEGYVTLGESLLGADVHEQGSGSLMWVEFELTKYTPDSLTVNFSTPYGEDTFMLNPDLDLIPMQTIDGAEILLFGLMGDLNEDGKVDNQDVESIVKLFGVHYPDPMYDPNCDIVYDHKIDMRDVGTVARHFGRTYP